MKIFNRTPVFLLACIVLMTSAISQPTYAESRFNQTGAGTFNWAGSVWDGSSPPGAGDDVRITNNTASAQVITNAAGGGSSTINFIVISNTTSSIQVIQNPNIAWTSSFGVQLATNANLTLTTNATFGINSSVTFDLRAYGTPGTLTLSNGANVSAMTLFLNAGTAKDLGNSGGTINFIAAAGQTAGINFGQTTFFTNSTLGTIVKDGAGTGTFVGNFGVNNQAFRNDGTIIVNSGTLVIDPRDANNIGGFSNTSTGFITVNSGGNFAISRTANAWDNNATSVNAGTINMNGGTMTLLQDASSDQQTNRVMANIGTIRGSGTLVLGINNNGGTVLATNGTLSVIGVVSNGFVGVTNGALNILGTVTNVAAVQLNTGSSLLITNGGKLFTTGANNGVGNAANATTATVTGVGSTWNGNNQDFRVGQAFTLARSNQLLIANGGVLTNIARIFIMDNSAGFDNSLIISNNGKLFQTGTLTVGQAGGSSNNLLQIGGFGSASYATNNGIVVGAAGAIFNRMIITNATVTSGTGANSGDTVVGTGNGSAFNVGTVTSDGTLNLLNNTLRVGAGGLASNNTLVVTGGGLVTNVNRIFVMDNIGGFGNSIQVTNNGKLFVIGNVTIAQATGAISNTVMISDGGSLFVAGAMQVGQATATTGSLFQVGGGGLQSFSTNGSVLVAAGTSASLNRLIVTNATLLSGGNMTLASGSGAINNTVTITTDGTLNLLNKELRVGGGLVSNNTFVVTGGGLATNINVVYISDIAAGYGNSLIISNGGKMFVINGMNVGQSGGAMSNTLIVANSGKLFTKTASVIGSGNTTNNAGTVTGSGSLWDLNNANLSVGASAVNRSNTLYVTSSGAVSNVGSVFIGDVGAGDSDGVSISDGGSLFTSGGVTVGTASGSSSNFYLVGGAGNSSFASNTTLTVGNTGAGFNQIVVTNATLFNNGAVIVGNGSSNNTATLSALGTWNWLGNDGTIGVGAVTGNVLTVTGGALTNVGTLNVGGGSLVLNSGTISAFQLTVTNNTLTATNSFFSFNGGRLTTSNTTGAVAARILTASNSTFNINGVWNMNGGTNSIASVHTPIAGNATNFVVVGNGVSNAAVNVGALAFWNLNTNILIVGNGAATGNVVNVTGGGRMQMDVGSGQVIVGSNANSTGNSIVVSGSGSSFSNRPAANLVIGMLGSSNSMTVADWAFVFNNLNFSMGDQSGANNNSATVTGSGAVLSNAFGGVLVGRSGGAYNSLVVSNGGKLFTGSANGLSRVGGNNAANNGNILQVVGTNSATGVASRWDAAFGTEVGNSGATNRLIIIGGGIFNNTGTLLIGNNSANNARSNSVVVSDTGSIWTNLGVVTIGGGGQFNTVILSNGASFVSGVVTVGNLNGAVSNAYNVGGLGLSSFASNGNLVVGNAGNFSSLVITNASLLSGVTTIGNGSSNNTAAVNNLGNWNALGNAISVGVGVASNNSLTVNSGGVLLASGGLIISADSNSSNNFVTVNSGGTLAVTNATASAQLIVGQSGFGTLTFNGSALTVNTLLVANNTTTTTNSFFNFNGTTLNTTNAATGLAARILTTSNSTYSINYTWNMLGGTNIIQSVQTPGTSATNTVAVGNGFFGAAVNVSAGAVWNLGTNVVNIGAGTSVGALLNITGGVVSNNTGLFNIGNGANTTGNRLVITNAGKLFAGGDFTVGFASAFNTGLVTGVGSTLDAGNKTLRVGSFFGPNHSNTLVVTDSGVVTNVLRIFLGDNSAGVGNSIVVTNGGKLFTSTGNGIVIGQSLTANNNSIVVAGGGVANTGFLTIGNDNASTNTAIVTGDGSLWNMNANILRVGGFFGGGTNTGNSLLITKNGVMTNVGSVFISDVSPHFNNGITISDGGKFFAGDIAVGQAVGSSSNYYNVGGAGAASYANNGAVTVGNSASGYNQLNVNNATLISGAATIGNGSTNNTANIGSGGIWNISGGLLVGANNTAANAVNVTGGGSLTVLSGGGLIGAASTFAASSSRVAISGVFTNAGTLTMLNSVGTFNSAVVNSGAWITDPTTNVFANTYTLTSSGYIISTNDVYIFTNSGSTVGSFINNSTQSNTTSLIDGKFLFDSTLALTQQFATAGDNIGNLDTDGGTNTVVVPTLNTSLLAQYSNNFALGTLELSGISTTMVYDSSIVGGRAHGGLEAALFLDTLTINPGTFLIISNNVQVYFINSNSFSQAQVSLLSGAGLHQLITELSTVPEPNVLLLWLAGLVTVFAARRRAAKTRG